MVSRVQLDIRSIKILKMIIRLHYSLFVSRRKLFYFDFSDVRQTLLRDIQLFDIKIELTIIVLTIFNQTLDVSIWFFSSWDEQMIKPIADQTPVCFSSSSEERPLTSHSYHSSGTKSTKSDCISQTIIFEYK